MVNYYKKITFKNQEFKSKIYTIFLSPRILYFLEKMRTTILLQVQRKLMVLHRRFVLGDVRHGPSK